MKPHRISHGADAPEALSVDGIGVTLDLTRLIPAVVRAHLAVVAVGEELAEAFLLARWPPHRQPAGPLPGTVGRSSLAWRRVPGRRAHHRARSGGLAHTGARAGQGC